ncbi:MAG: diguanylate cyclase, partial [Desulfonatronovibrio sp.]
MTNQGKLITIVSGVLIVGMVLTAIIWYSIYVSYQATQRQSLKAHTQDVRKQFTRFEYSTRLYLEKIETRLQQKQEAISGLRELFSTRKTVSWEEFNKFVSPVHEQYPEVYGVFWIPRIAREALDKFAQLAAKDSPPGFRLRIDKQDIPLGNTDVWPIYFVAPVESNRSWLGLNAETHPIFAGAFEDYVEKQPWLSTPFAAKGEAYPEEFFLAINLTNEEQRLSSDKEYTMLYKSGFVAALIDIPTLLKTAVEELDAADPLKIYLYDSQGRRIATNGPLTDEEQKASQSLEQLEKSLTGTTYINRKINVAGEDQRWQAFFEPEQPIVKPIPSETGGRSYSWLVAVVGLLITILLAVFAYRVTNEMLRRKAAEQEQRQLAERDGLTNLLNRHVLSNILEREWTRSYQAGQSLSVLVLDLDHFKSINDTYGHTAGDDILRHMGAILRNTARQTDAACRYGGEEFCLILPETDSYAAYNVADRIRDKVASKAVSIPQ